jgi:hypothetical protein
MLSGREIQISFAGITGMNALSTKLRLIGSPRCKVRGSKLAGVVALVVVAGLAVSAAAAEKPLALHPDNPHYFLFRGKPTVIITSGEHYGAVLNLDFDYVKYLDELAAHGLNNTRTWAGAYVEDTKDFNITQNTLAPLRDRFICPFARSDTPGYPNGGNKFDLTKWDEAYFRRLKDFLTQASERGVIVEMILFCPFYEESMWKLSPQNAENNVNNIGRCKRGEVYTLDKNDGLLAIHEAMTRKIVTELNEFDNLYYEVCNEPYERRTEMAWQHRIADVIVDTEKALPNKHLISMNISNGSAKIENPHPAISIFNFHYASPPTAVAENYHLNKVIGDNETGFKGTKDDHYRMEAWEFILAGGALYNNLDYSFTAGHEDGTFEYPDRQPGGGTRELRRQLKVLKEFIESFDFVRMKPGLGDLKSKLGEDVRCQVLSERGKQYAIYVKSPAAVELELELPQGAYDFEQINAITGKTIEKQRSEHTGGVKKIKTVEVAKEVALRIKAAN